MNRDVTAGHLAGVSEREAEVLSALSEHLSNAQIASRMHISIRTVESHVSSDAEPRVAMGVRSANASP